MLAVDPIVAAILAFNVSFCLDMRGISKEEESQAVISEEVLHRLLGVLVGNGV